MIQAGSISTAAKDEKLKGEQEDKREALPAGQPVEIKKQKERTAHWERGERKKKKKARVWWQAGTRMRGR